MRHGATLQEFYDSCETLLFRLGWAFGKDRDTLANAARIAAQYFGGPRNRDGVKTGRLTWFINSYKVLLKELKFSVKSDIINMVAAETYCKTRETHEYQKVSANESDYEEENSVLVEDPDEATEVMKNVVLFPMFDVHLETKETELCDYTFTGTADEIVIKIQKLLNYRKGRRRRVYNLDLNEPHLDLRTLYATLDPLLALYPQDAGTDQAGFQKEMGATYSARYPVMFHGGRLHMGLSLLVKAQKPKGMSIPPMMDTSTPAELLLAFLRGEERELGAWIALFYDTPLHALMWFYNFLFQTKLCDDFTMNTKCQERFQAWEDGNRSHQTFHWCLFLLDAFTMEQLIRKAVK